MFLWKYKDKQFFREFKILAEGVFVNQLFGTAVIQFDELCGLRQIAVSRATCCGLLAIYCTVKICYKLRKKFATALWRHSLGLLHGIGHGQEDAVEQDGCHDDVVEVLVRRQEDARPADRVPGREQEEGVRGREAVDVVFTEPLRNHAERLKQDNSTESL